MTPGQKRAREAEPDHSLENSRQAVAADEAKAVGSKAPAKKKLLASVSVATQIR